MMRKSLIFLGLVATAGFLFAGWRGYQGDTEPAALRDHLDWALAASLLMLLSHAAIALYLIATQRMVRSMAAERGLGERFTAEAREHVRRAVPAILVAIVALVLAVCAGGGLFARWTPSWTHHASVYAALAVQLVALRQEMVHLPAQDRLIGDLDREVGAA
jgi:hypothetical protein